MTDGMPMSFLRAIAAAATLALQSEAALAQSVTLSAPTGFTLSGDILAFDGEFYRIETEFGPVTVAAAGLACSGSACPGPVTERVSLAAADPSLKRLSTALFRDFAAMQGWPVLERHDRTGLAALVLGGEEGSPALVVDFAPAPGAWRLLRDPRDLPPTGFRDRPVAFDALVPAVSLENPATSLTLLSVRAALAGEFPDWVGLGGGETPLSVHWPAGLEGPLIDRYRLSPGAGGVRHASFADAADAVARTPGGLGLLPLSEIGSAVPIVVTGSCGRGAIGVEAAIRSGDYPLSEAVLLRVPARRAPPLSRAFLDWIDTPSAHASTRRAGFVDLGVGPVPQGRDGRQEAMPEVLPAGGGQGPSAPADALGEARRLDVAIRFRDGSSLPDRAARIQIARLERAIASGRFDGMRLIFAGFSDANGSEATNLDLSRRRAEAIRSEVLSRTGAAAKRVTLEARGFGEAMPVACNGSDWGESLNRRVEVWVAEPDGQR